MRCKNFCNYARGSDPNRVWNAAECKCTLEALLKGVFPKGVTEQPRHLNRAERQNPAANPLTTNALQDFQRLHPWFRSQPGLEHRRLQMCLGGTSGRGLHQTRNRTAHASEPKQNPRNSPQLIEKLSIARFQQASPLVQMQRKRVASEPRNKAKFNTQLTHNKQIARPSATTPVVQIPGGFGTPQNANTPWKCFWQGYPPNTQ